MKRVGRIRKVLFVCSGNTCRSPMAALLFAQEARSAGVKVEVASRGLAAAEGWPASRRAIEVMREWGLDLSRHKSRSLNRQDVEDSDLVLTMTTAHAERIKQMWPFTQNKVFALKEYIHLYSGAGSEEEEAGGDMDIMDPFGQTLSVYRRCAQEIEAAVKSLVKILSQQGVDPLRIALAADHGGVMLKDQIKCWLEEMGLSVEDFGTYSTESVDYPDYARIVGEKVASGEFDRGILVCGTGIGMSIAANKIPGIRAALCHDVFSARATREHNDSNILCLGERVVGPGHARAIVEAWLGTEFAGGRHARRVDKIGALENAYFCRPGPGGGAHDSGLASHGEA